jgi:hypothetical protein
LSLIGDIILENEDLRFAIHQASFLALPRENEKRSVEILRKSPLFDVQLSLASIRAVHPVFRRQGV